MKIDIKGDKTDIKRFYSLSLCHLFSIFSFHCYFLKETLIEFRTPNSIKMGVAYSQLSCSLMAVKLPGNSGEQR